MSAVRALLNCDISYHKPIIGELYIPGVTEAKRKVIDRRKLSRKLKLDPRFGEITMNGEVCLTTTAAAFVEAVRKIAEDKNMTTITPQQQSN